MALSIKNQRAEQLANELANETHETMTQAVIRSLEERLERLRGRKNIKDTFERMMEISERCRSLPDIDSRTPEEILSYNEIGTFR